MHWLFKRLCNILQATGGSQRSRSKHHQLSPACRTDGRTDRQPGPSENAALAWGCGGSATASLPQNPAPCCQQPGVAKMLSDALKGRDISLCSHGTELFFRISPLRKFPLHGQFVIYIEPNHQKTLLHSSSKPQAHCIIIY